MTSSHNTTDRWAGLRAKVLGMTAHERAERAADLIDVPEPTNEDDMEFTKLVCGPDATIADLMRLINPSSSSPPGNAGPS